MKKLKEFIKRNIWEIVWSIIFIANIYSAYLYYNGWNYEAMIETIINNLFILVIIQHVIYDKFKDKLIKSQRKLLDWYDKIIEDIITNIKKWKN